MRADIKKGMDSGEPTPLAIDAVKTNDYAGVTSSGWSWAAAEFPPRQRFSKTHVKGTALQKLTKRDGSLVDIVKVFGGMFSAELGIDLSSSNRHEIDKWFLAAILFGARISEAISIKTYKVFEEEKILSPAKILDTGWDGLVGILDRGGYVRYDFKTATKLLEVSRSLLDGYAGNLNTLHEMASDPRDLEKRLKFLGKGIGDVTVNIFLREMRGIWEKARPLPSEIVLLAARDLDLLAEKTADRNNLLQILMDAWVGEGNELKDFADFEAALVRFGLALRKRATFGKRARKT